MVAELKRLRESTKDGTSKKEQVGVDVEFFNANAGANVD